MEIEYVGIYASCQHIFSLPASPFEWRQIVLFYIGNKITKKK